MKIYKKKKIIKFYLIDTRLSASHLVHDMHIDSSPLWYTCWFSNHRAIEYMGHGHNIA